MIDHYRHAQVAELAKFRKRWPRQFGRYPHHAADATVMRYHEADHVRWGP